MNLNWWQQDLFGVPNPLRLNKVTPKLPQQQYFEKSVVFDGNIQADINYTFLQLEIPLYWRS
jgi:hypothetical protein